MAKANNLGKTVVLFILVIVLALLGALWFDYLGVIQAKHLFAPIYKVMGLSPQTSRSMSSVSLDRADLDNDRFIKRLEALDTRTEELNKRESDVATVEERNTQVAQELEDKRLTLEEREKTFTNTVKQYDERNTNIEQIVANLNGMPPQKAVDILVAMDDQDVIDVLRKTEEIAQQTGGTSLGSYWLSLMKPDRAAQIQRKMANKPLSID